MGDRNNKSKQLTKSGNRTVKLNTHIKGTIAEYQEVVNWSKAGYWVAKSCDPQCPFDLVAVSPDGDIQLLDIKLIHTENILNHTEEKFGEHLLPNKRS